MNEPSNGILRLGIGRLIARQRVPYFRAALLGSVCVESPGLGTFAITKDFVLYYDPEVAAKLTDEEVAFVLVHELFHPLNKHWARGAGHPGPKINIAGDLAINQLVRDMGFTPPAGVLFPAMYGFPEKLGIEGYLALLPDDVQAPDDPQRGDGEEGNNSADGSAEGQNQGKGKESKNSGAGKGADGDTPKVPGLCRGRCGSGAGNPVPGEPTGGGAPEESKDGGAKGTIQGSTPTEGRSVAEAESIRRRVAEAIQEHATKGRGNIPGELVRWANDALTPPKIPWEQKLATLCRHAVAFRPGALDYRYTGISRRQAGIGYGPGKPVLPTLRSPIPRVAFLMDTSGSMGKDEAMAGLAEGRGVMLALGAEMTFIAVDTRVHGVTKIRDWRKMRELLKGGGGTNLIPAFEALKALHPRPEVIVCVTDGQVGDGIPKLPPPGMKVIFVLVGKCKTKPCAWGHHVEVD